MRSRYGKLSGSAKAAASVTMPRIPHQDTMMPRSTVGTAGETCEGSRPCASKARRKAPYGITQAMRAKTTTARIVAAKLQYLNRTHSYTTDQSRLSFIPLKMNTHKIQQK